jgi:hypothetical protein
MIFEISFIFINEIYTLALIQWYDFKHKNSIKKHFLYECPWLELLESFDCIPIDSISHLVHIIPRFDLTNEFLVNVFLF